MNAIDMVVLKNKKQYERADFNKKEGNTNQLVSPKRDAGRWERDLIYV